MCHAKSNSNNCPTFLVKSYCCLSSKSREFCPSCHFKQYKRIYRCQCCHLVCYTESTPGGHIQLWHFLLDLLMSPSSENEGVLVWDGPSGEFHIRNPEKLAKLWGSHKNRPNMTYEKLTRALRYYYEKNLMSKVAGKRHSYCFHFVSLLTEGYTIPPSLLEKLLHGSAKRLSTLTGSTVITDRDCSCRNQAHSYDRTLDIESHIGNQLLYSAHSFNRGEKINTPLQQYGIKNSTFVDDKFHPYRNNIKQSASHISYSTKVLTPAQRHPFANNHNIPCPLPVYKNHHPAIYGKSNSSYHHQALHPISDHHSTPPYSTVTTYSQIRLWDHVFDLCDCLCVNNYWATCKY